MAVMARALSGTRSRSARLRRPRKAARLVCGACRTKCHLALTNCPICEAAPRLSFGGYSILGVSRRLHDASACLANSAVFLARARHACDEVAVAVKLVSLQDEEGTVAMARRELAVLRKLQPHPNLLPLLFGVEMDSELVLLTPYAPGGDLDARARGPGGAWRCLEERDAAGLAGQLLAGLSALQAVGYVHGDVKPQNVLLTGLQGAYVAQLGDFGLTQEEGRESCGGTSGYMAPELVGSEAGGKRPTAASAADLFALGVLLYQVLACAVPFMPASNVLAPLEFEELCWAPLLPSARHFVAQLLAKDAQERGAARCHAWLAEGLAVERGAMRPRFAPVPDPELRFHSAAGALEASRSCRCMG